ncbi:MFS transporter [Pseudomonas gingeri NCPPB 3146 = LMG 5327]|uniref:MFS transporter n=3 Tax=Pseudomonas gingeri TaxID=117681 RepID=A0A7Y7XW33_9PSED|nr:MFS transporter [Pseudomonas gingeri]NVZ24538.1 MFS transporter [Pseudomonas gingeri]NWC13397.1 MFS transporter [Pseudomonas gingeri]NWE45186.1 MFS transporter [Pseudomonas gingeri]PNQ94442.1 MFS transporter [Pseudomonas gingeri NCPPB 3146 = LMG 5327]
MSTPLLQQRLILLAVCITAITMPFNFTAAAVALPAIGRAFGGSPMELSWVTNAFMLTFGSCLMLAGALADSYGRKKVFIGGASAFAVLAAALPFAPDLVVFDILRAAQGLAAAAAFSGGMSALAQVFDGPGRIRAFSFVGASFGIGLAFGPVLAGAIIEAFDWHLIFLLITVLAAISLVLAARCMQESRNPEAAGIDWPGAITFTWALGIFTFAILKVPESGWTDPLSLGLFVVALLSFVAFVLIEQRVAQPMLDLSLFRFPRFVGVQLLAAAPAYSFVVLLILLPIRFVGIEGMSEIAAGWLLIALSAPLLVLPIVAGYLTRWLSPSTLCGSGLLVCAAGLYWLSHVPVGSGAWQLAWPMLVIGVGISLPWGLMDGMAVSVVPKERAGMATGIFSTTRVAGEGVAIAVVTALLSAFTAGNLAALPADALPNIVAAAQHLATGDLSGAEHLLPAAGRTALAQGYSAAFSTLLLVLTAITVLTAAVVFLFLDRGSVEDDSDDEMLTHLKSPHQAEHLLPQPAECD